MDLPTKQSLLFAAILAAFCNSAFCRSPPILSVPSEVRGCYSCMSDVYLSNWPILSNHFYPPLDYTNKCENPIESESYVRSEPCQGVCISLAERLSIGGVAVGTGYMRGCIDRMLLYPQQASSWPVLSNETSQYEQCRLLNWQMVLDVQVQDVPAKDKRGLKQHVEVCVCKSNNCNASPHWNVKVNE